MRAAEAAEAAARATLVSPEEERVIIDAAEALAGTVMPRCAGQFATHGLSGGGAGGRRTESSR